MKPIKKTEPPYINDFILKNFINDVVDVLFLIIKKQNEIIDRLNLITDNIKS